MKKSLRWLKRLNKPEKLLLTLGVFALLVVGSNGGHSNQQTNLNAINASSKSAASNQTPATPKVTTRIVTETQTIPFLSTTAQDSGLAKGTTKITTPGVNGTRTLTYEVTYKDGRQTSKRLLSSQVTSQPVTQVTTIGTYVAPAPVSCPNGTYVNSSGNSVCRPYSSSSAPAGATAKCVDGSYSFSQHHSGTCSHHGGVASWL